MRSPTRRSRRRGHPGREVDGGEDRFNYEIGDEPGSGSMFMQCNRNKKGVTLNPTKPEGREIQDKLIATADVVIANMPPRALEQLGLDPRV